MNVKEAYQKKLEAQIDLWKAQLDVLRARAKKEDAKLRHQYEDEIDALRKKIGDIGDSLVAIKGAGADAWEDLTDGAESALVELELSLKDALSRFKDS